MTQTRAISTKYAGTAVVEAGFLLDDLIEGKAFDADAIISQLAKALEPWATEIVENFRIDRPDIVARLVAEVVVVQFYHDRGELLPDDRK
jgi:hypothetical protein